MEHVWNKERFAASAPAEPIFAYVQSSGQLRGQALDFEYALLDEGGRHGVVKFACHDARSPVHGTVWVSADFSPQGRGWQVKHTLGF